MKKALGLALLCVLVGCSDPTGGGKLTITKHENGQTASRGYLLNDNIKVGDWVYFYENGKQEKQGSYFEDQMHGEWTFWHDNGQKESEGGYKVGKRDGVWTLWDDQGNGTHVFEWKDGEMLNNR